jgi:hypothetical protein
LSGEITTTDKTICMQKPASFWKAAFFNERPTVLRAVFWPPRIEVLSAISKGGEISHQVQSPQHARRPAPISH